MLPLHKWKVIKEECCPTRKEYFRGRQLEPAAHAAPSWRTGAIRNISELCEMIWLACSWLNHHLRPIFVCPFAFEFLNKGGKWQMTNTKNFRYALFLPLGLLREASDAFPPSPQWLWSKGRHWSPVPATTSAFLARSFVSMRDFAL